jgi:hypothetical protein
MGTVSQPLKTTASPAMPQEHQNYKKNLAFMIFFRDHGK